MLSLQGPKGLISKLFSHLLQSKIYGDPLRARVKCQVAIPDMTDQDWEEICSSHLKASPAINNKIIQLNIVHQTYLSPNKLYKMRKLLVPNCARWTGGSRISPPNVVL